MKAALAELYSWPRYIRTPWLRVVCILLWWAVLTCCVVLTWLSWALVIGWWWVLVQRPRVRW